ncbi:MAG: hypothetical protein IKT55_04725 [Clostridia bacterium]|nr:hypothetical protein [Clostridia bacterium]
MNDMDNLNNNQNTVNDNKIEPNSQPPKKKKKTKSKGAIIALVIALVLCIIIIIGLVVMGVLGLLGVGVAGIFMLNKNEDSAVQVVETTEAITEEKVTENGGVIATEPVSTDANNTAQEVTEEYNQSDYYGGNSLYITYDTPAHAGVNLRETPEDDSVKIMVLPEGTEVVRLYEAGETYQTKYVLVSVVVDGVEYRGYVMQRYISTFTGASFDAYVSYNTPDHAGLVLRETSSYYSDKILVIPEGTELRVVDSSTGAYWAVDAFYEGEIYSGYVLSTYIEYVD